MTYVSALLAKDASRILPFDGYELKTKAEENAFVSAVGELQPGEILRLFIDHNPFNLIRKIAQGKLDSKPKYRQLGSVLVATFKGWYALDNNGSGAHTVTTSDGRNAPYASYLNYSKRFPSYNGFFDLAKDTYRQSLIDRFEDSYEHTFEKTYRF